MVKIFVKGKEDKLFIEKYLEFLSKNNSLQKYIVENVGGWTKIRDLSQRFEENSDSGGTNLVVFDADTIAKGGGFQVRSQEINSIAVEYNISFELFLFPDNSSEGDFESLLESIINKNHRCLLDCFEGYENCLSREKDNKGNNRYNSPLRKSKIYSYVDAFPKSKRDKEKFKKGDYFFDKVEYWDMTSNGANSLKDFLLLHVKM